MDENNPNDKSRWQRIYMLGLYYLDFLNLTTSLILIPAFIAMAVAHRNVYKPYVLITSILFIMGNTVFIANNASLSMLELSRKYAVSVSA